LPLFDRNGAVDQYIPVTAGFGAEEEDAALRRVDKVIPMKKWAFTQHCIPEGYTGISINHTTTAERAQAIHDAGLQTIGLDLEARANLKEVLQRCDAVAYNMRNPHIKQIRSVTNTICGLNVPKIALGVNTRDDYDLTRAGGYDYFLGEFYLRHIFSEGTPKAKLGPIQANKLAVLAEVTRWQHESTDNFEQIAQIVQRDVFLTLSLIKMANSAFFGSVSKVNTLKDAIVRIGIKNLTSWSTAILTTAVTEKRTPEIARSSLVRARFMENLAAAQRKNRWLAFFTGLASVSDVMLGEPLKEALQDMHAPPEVERYLNYHDDIGYLYGLATAYIAGNKRALTSLVANDAALGERLHTAYISAELWVGDILHSIE
jgi:EAL and modified HD-GYP domain-containing signal transduction protein